MRANLFLFWITSKCHWKLKAPVCFAILSLNRKPRPETRGSQGIEQETKTWDKVIVDRKGDLTNWVEMLRVMPTSALCAGHDPGTVEPSAMSIASPQLRCSIPSL